MSFYHRYELVKLVRNGEPKSFQAREIQSGRNVLLHLWSMTEQGRQSPVLARLRDQMRNDPTLLLGLVVEVQEHADPPYAVTVFEEGFPGLDLWLDGQLLVSQAAAPRPAPQGAPPKQEPPVLPPAAGLSGLFGGEMGRKPDALGETTRMEIPAQPRAAQPPPAAEMVTPAKAVVLPKIEDPEAPTRMLDEPTLREWQTPPVAVPKPQPPSVVAQQPGEFTQMFQGKTPEAPPPVAVPKPQPPPVVAQQPGEFTQMFQGKAPEAPPPVAVPKPQPPPVVAQQPGEFTQMFQGGAPLPPPPVAPAPAATAASTPEPGEFTRIFQGGSTALSPAAPAPGDFTCGQQPDPALQPPPATPEATEPQPAGEFTRLFTVRAAAPPPEHAVRINVAARQADAGPLRPPNAAPPVPAVPPPPPAVLPAGESEFTRLFGNPVAPPVSGPPQGAAPAPPVPPVSSGGEGEFTRFFASPLGANPLPVEQLERGVYQPPAPAPSDKPFRGPSDFTIRFGSPGGPQDNVPPPPAHAPGAPAATGLFAIPQQAPLMPPAQGQQPSGPSEFTRVLQGPHFQQSGDLTGGQAQGPGSISVPAPGGVPLPAPPRQSKWVGILVGILTCLVIVLVIVVVILALKK